MDCSRFGPVPAPAALVAADGVQGPGRGVRNTSGSSIVIGCSSLLNSPQRTRTPPPLRASMACRSAVRLRGSPCNRSEKEAAVERRGSARVFWATYICYVHQAGCAACPFALLSELSSFGTPWPLISRAGAAPREQCRAAQTKTRRCRADPASPKHACDAGRSFAAAAGATRVGAGTGATTGAWGGTDMGMGFVMAHRRRGVWLRMRCRLKHGAWLGRRVRWGPGVGRTSEPRSTRTTSGGALDTAAASTSPAAPAAASVPGRVRPSIRPPRTVARSVYDCGRGGRGARGLFRCSRSRNGARRDHPAPLRGLRCPRRLADGHTLPIACPTRCGAG